MTYDQVALRRRVARARCAVGKGIKYKLGKGGFHPDAPFPDGSPVFSHAGKAWRFGKECDCSGFVAWVLGMRRDQINAKKWWSKLLPWIETTMVFKDATGPRRVFVKIPAPVPGCLVVYGDKAGSEGHIGVVSVVGATGMVTVIDCSSGMSRKTGDAIHERNGDFFLRAGAIFCVLKQDVVS